MSKPMSAEGRESRRLRDWAVANPAPVLTVVGILLYGSVKLDYFIFYTRLGIDPDEVGLTYTEVLSRSALALFLLASLIGVTFLIIFTIFRVFSRPESPTEFTLLFALMWALGLVILGIRVSFDSSTAVREGYTVRPSLCQLLGLRAEVASVRWLGPGRSPLGKQDALSTYVGQSDGSTILFDANTGSKVVVPSSLVLLTVLGGHDVRINSKRLSHLLAC